MTYLSTSHPFLWASLDSVVTNVEWKTWGVEVKCFLSKLDQSINDVLEDKKFYLEKTNGKIQLKWSHKYLFQIQGQLFCIQLKRNGFVIYFEKKRYHCISRLYRSIKILTTNFTTNWDFFQKIWIVPELFTLRVQRGKKLFQHSDWKNKKKRKNSYLSSRIS